jgi:hypothetical protein
MGEIWGYIAHSALCVALSPMHCGRLLTIHTPVRLKFRHALERLHTCATCTDSATSTTLA